MCLSYHLLRAVRRELVRHLSSGFRRADAVVGLHSFDSPEIIEYRARVDMLDLMDAEDPPFYAQNDLEPAGPNAPPLTVNLAFHHANHALVLAEKADEIGLENVVYIKGLMIEDPSGEDSLGFALRHFGL